MAEMNRNITMCDTISNNQCDNQSQPTIKSEQTFKILQQSRAFTSTFYIIQIVFNSFAKI